MQAFNESMNLKEGTTATQYLGSLQQLASLQETLALSTESANLVQGESRALLEKHERLNRDCITTERSAMTRTNGQS